MTSKKTAVFGIYATQSGAENAIDTLTRSGFPVSDVSVLVPETLGSKDMGTVKATKAPEGATAGATSGCWLALEPWPFLAWGLSSPRGLSWPHWPGWASEEQ